MSFNADAGEDEEYLAHQLRADLDRLVRAAVSAFNFSLYGVDVVPIPVREFSTVSWDDALVACIVAKLSEEIH